MSKERIFLIKEVSDTEYINGFFEKLEAKGYEYEVDYDYEEGFPGILVYINWDEQRGDLICQYMMTLELA